MAENNFTPSKIEQGLEASIRETFKNTPMVMLEDQARMLKDVTVRVCDEYIAKGKAFKEQWALNIVREMFGGAVPQKLEKGKEESNETNLI